MHTLQAIKKRARHGLRAVALPFGTALAGAALTALVFAAAGEHDVTAQPERAGEVRTERLTVVGPDGTPRVVLVGEGEVAGLRGSGLVVLDRDGRTPRLAQGVSEDGQQTGFALFDQTGALRLDLETGREGRDDGSVNINGLDRQGTSRFELSFDPAREAAGAANLRLNDLSGRARAILNAFPDGGVALFLHDPAGRQRVAVGIPPGRAPEIVLLDEAGNPVWRAP